MSDSTIIVNPAPSSGIGTYILIGAGLLVAYAIFGESDNRKAYAGGRAIKKDGKHLSVKDVNRILRYGK